MPKALPKNSQFSLTHFFGRFKLHWKLLFYMPGTKALLLLLNNSLSLTQTPTHISQETTVPTHPVFFANSRKHRGGRTSPPYPYTQNRFLFACYCTAQAALLLPRQAEKTMQVAYRQAIATVCIRVPEHHLLLQTYACTSVQFYAFYLAQGHLKRDF